MPAILQAAKRGNLQCAKLLLDNCDVNRAITTSTHRRYGICTNFDGFVLSLGSKWDGPFRWHMDDDADFTLDNEVHCHILNLFLDNKADVDLPMLAEKYDHPFNLYQREKDTVKSRLTILERAFHADPKIYHRIRRYSSSRKGSLLGLEYTTRRKAVPKLFAIT